MENSRTMVWGGALAVLVLTSLGGAVALNSGVVGMATGGEGGGCNAAPAAIPEEKPEDVIVDQQSFNPQGGEGPTDAFLEATYVDGVYTLKLSVEAAGELVQKDGGEIGLGPKLGELLAVLKPGNPTFHFNDGDSPLIEHYLEKYRPDSHPIEDAGKPGVNAKAMHNERIGVDRIIVIELDGDRDDVLDHLDAIGLLEWSEPVFFDRAASVNDAYFGYQWNMATLNVTQLWDITDGAGTMVAVLDTGVSTFSDGIPNLLLDKCYDFITGGKCKADVNGHGSHIAGTIAQANHNGVGVVGIAPGVELLPVTVLDDNGNGRAVDIAAGIVYAVDQGADIINISVGGYIESHARSEAVQYALKKGAVIIASVGNDGFTDAITYPAAYEGVIAVGATDMSGAVTKYSNQSKQVDLLAPGGDLSKDDDDDGVPDGILQETIRGGVVGFHVFEGTSSAAAHVSGIAALLHSSGVKPNEIRGTLLGTKDNLGMVSALDALQSVRKTEAHDMPAPE